jgi:hypothetical protein
VSYERRQVPVIELEPGQTGDPAAFRATRLDAETRERLASAVQHGVAVEKDSTGRLTPVFYDVYRAWAERWIPRSGLPAAVARRRALQAEPYAKFATMAAQMGEACRVFVAWLHGRPIAASVLLVHGEHASTWRSYSVPEVAAPVSARLLTQVTCIEDAVSSGCRSIDLGHSGHVANLEHYRNSLGAAARSVVDLRIEPAGLARLRAARARAEGVLVRALTRSPASPILGRPTP